MSISGSLAPGSGTYVFTGNGQAGQTVVITVNGAAVGSGVIGPDGSFNVAISTTLAPGDGVQAHAGNATGPALGSLTVGASPVSLTGTGAANPYDLGASVITVLAPAGSVVTLVGDPDGPGPQPNQVLGSAVAGPNGMGAVVLKAPLSNSGATLSYTVNGQLGGSLSNSGLTGSAPSVDPGPVLTDGSTLHGQGIPGATVQAVDAQGTVLGSALVAANGQWVLPVSGGHGLSAVKVIQNGVAASVELTALTAGAENHFLSSNILHPGKGAPLQINFKPSADGHVTVRIFDVAGELVQRPFEADAKAGLWLQAQWQGDNMEGQTVASGLYVISVRGAGLQSLRKVVVLK